MKTLTKSILIVLCLTLFGSAQLFGQEWSGEQKEVWASVENWWQAWADRDIDKINSCIGEGFRGRSERFHAPYTMKSSQSWWKHWTKNYKVIVQHVTPVAIDIHNDIAIVFLSYQSIVANKEGTEKEEQGKWTEIYKKTDGKWLIISETGFDFSSPTN
jgi:ketosteroid isomerase-like protein